MKFEVTSDFILQILPPKNALFSRIHSQNLKFEVASDLHTYTP